MRQLSNKPIAARRRGVVLLAVLVVVTLLTLAAYQFSSLMIAELEAADAYRRSVQARALADSGVHYTAALLCNPDTMANTLGSNPYSSPQYFQKIVVHEHQVPRFQGCFTVLALVDPEDPYAGSQPFRFGVSDECGKLNINALMQLDRTGDILYDALMMLPNMTDEVANAIVDWLDEDDEPRPNGAENEYYQSLSPPYRTKNGPLDTLDELLLVKGVSFPLLYGNDRNRNGVLDPDEAGDSATLDRGWSAYLTVHSREQNVNAQGQPRIYVNDQDLETLYNKLTTPLGQDLANYILAYRQYGPASTQSGGTGSSGAGSSGTGSGMGGGSTGSGGSGRGGTGGSNPGTGSGMGGSRGGAAGGGNSGSPQGRQSMKPTQPLDLYLPNVGITALFAQAGRPTRPGQQGQGQQGPSQQGATPSRPTQQGPTMTGVGGAGAQGNTMAWPTMASPTPTATGGGSASPVTAGRGQLSRNNLNFRQGQPRRIASLFDLINSSVEIPSSNQQQPATRYPSPLNDPTSLRQLLPLLLDQVTTSRDAEMPARVNINTAPHAVLLTLPGLTEADAQTIVDHRPNPLATEPPDAIYQTPAWLITEANLPAQTVKTIERYITARTQVYRVQVLGYFEGGGPTARVEAVIDTNNGRPRILYWRDLTELGKGFELPTGQ